VSIIVIPVDSVEPDRLFASRLRAMRRSLDVTRTQLARAYRVPRRSIAAIEAGGAASRAERHDIAIACSWLSANRVAKGLAKTD
jgi:DNA-binding XRE family transcriptional regulator